MTAVSKSKLTPLERLLSLFTQIRPREGYSAALLMLNAFLILLSYYVLKTLREPLILTEFSAEVRAYAVAMIAFVLIFLVPVYGVIFRRIDPTRLVQWITVFFVLNLVVFYLMGQAEMELGFIYFVWVGVFSVMVIAQFWALAADIYNVKSGQRLFPVIMAGASLGALAGSQVVKLLLPVTGPFNLMLISGGVLLSTIWLGPAARRVVPKESAGTPNHKIEQKFDHAIAGFGVVFRDRYLMLIAAMVVLLNWINSTGEYILAELVSQDAAARLEAGSISDLGTAIGVFYGDFFFWVTLIGLFFQVFLVSRIYRWIGVSGALLILPLIAMAGYGLVIFVPIFSIIRYVKILENSVDYSIMNTTRHALFLPTTRIEKYEGKTAIDTFFWRFGDLIQAGVVFLGLNVLDFGISQFAALNLVLAAIWFAIAIALGREYNRRITSPEFNVPPVLNRPIPNVLLPSGTPLDLVLADDTFTDADPGDVLTLKASLPDGSPLPPDVAFDPYEQRFSGKLPREYDRLDVQVMAVDVDGMSASTIFSILRADGGENE